MTVVTAHIDTQDVDGKTVVTAQARYADGGDLLVAVCLPAETLADPRKYEAALAFIADAAPRLREYIHRKEDIEGMVD